MLGVGLNLAGLVPRAWYGATAYTDPVEKANGIVDRLRHREGCDYVICLSHLGHQYDEQICDLAFAGKPNTST